MVYYVTPQSPRYRQMSLEEFWFSNSGAVKITDNETNTRTYLREELPDQIRRSVNPFHLRAVILEFNKTYEELFRAERHSLYHSFRILKRSGGFRQIDAPLPGLMKALRDLKAILETKFGAAKIYHTSAFAYVKKRCCVDAVKRHQQNESWWFAKLDFSNFFGSTTKEFVMRQLAGIFPFSELFGIPGGREAFEQAIDLAFLDGVLPQGTPLSPLITNMMMVPIDYALANGLLDLDGQKFIYTRYADDMMISSRREFKLRDIEEYVQSVIRDFNAPFVLNQKKSHYGSRSGSNWSLGVVLNKDNKISIGYKNLRNFKSMLHNFLRDLENGVSWDLGDLQHAVGLYSYYVMVDPDTILATVESYKQKTGRDAIYTMKRLIAGETSPAEAPSPVPVEAVLPDEAFDLFDVPFEF